MDNFGANDSAASKVDPELQEFLMQEKQKAQVTAQASFHS